MNIEAYIKRFHFHSIAVLCGALLRDHGNGLSLDGPGFCSCCHLLEASGMVSSQNCSQLPTLCVGICKLSNKVINLKDVICSVNYSICHWGTFKC